jgi:hypothetical protein
VNEDQGESVTDLRLLRMNVMLYNTEYCPEVAIYFIQTLKEIFLWFVVDHRKVACG